MLRGVEVLGGVLILGIIAAANMAALLAHAQVHPVVAKRYALGANVLGSGFETSEGGEVLARFGHGPKVRNGQ
jgi:hypothetical protein